jgi:glutamine synthetase
MRKDKVIVNALGKEFADLYDNIKKAEWNEYMKQVSDWELNRYLVKM